MRTKFISLDSVLIRKPREWFEGVIQKFRNTKQGLVNLWNWLPVIWNDRWWDYHFLLVILRHKLFLDSQRYYRDGHLESSESISDSMDRCSILCNSLINDDYLEDELDELCRKYPIDMIEGAPEEDGSVQIQFVQDPVGRELVHELIKKKEKMWQEDKNRLFAIMNKELTNWSD